MASRNSIHKCFWVTPSDVRDFAVCPWIVYQRKVLGNYSNVTTRQMVAGSFEHEARRRVVDNILHKRIGPEVVERSVQESYDYAIVSYAEFSHSINEMKDSLTQRISGELEELAGAPLFASEIPLASYKLHLRGRLDCLYHVAGEFTPCDYKTGSDDRNHNANVLQVVTYAILIEENLGPVSQGMIHYTTLGRQVVFPITKGLRAKVMSIVSKIQLMYEAQWLPNFNPLTIDLCKDCRYFGFCSEYISQANLARVTQA